MKRITLIVAFILAAAVPVMSAGGATAQMATSHQVKGASHQMVHGGGMPTLPGQDAFGAIQEIVGILEADPSTDWSRVDISALRSHLVDMNRVVLEAEVREKPIDGGLEMAITGQGRTLQAIQAMAPAHAPTIDGLNGWTVKAEMTANGARLTVTAGTAREAAHIRGLGFFGLMVTGSHHQAHHLGMARGEAVHAQ